MQNILVILFVCIASITIHAQQTPAKAQTEVITITGATAHIGNGTILQNSVITFKNGKITAIGTANEAIPSGTVIDATTKHIYPGFIAPNTTLGLVEVAAVRASDDKAEIGTYNPHIRSLIAYNAESLLVETTRPNGVLIAQITPRGGRISGTSSIVQLDAWNWEDAALKVDDGIHINWPKSFTRARWWDVDNRGLKPNKKYSKQIEELNAYMIQAKTSLKSPTTVIQNLPHNALKGVLDGSQTLFIHVQMEKAILDAVAFAEKHHIKKTVLVGGDEAYKVAEQLKQKKIPVLLTRTHSTPLSEDMDYDLPYKNARVLMNAGVLVALQNSGQMERANVRNLPFQAGTVAAHGLDKEKALQLITGNTAKILGIDHQTGTLEVGKDATLFISKGDALDMRTNQLEKAFIQGRDISLETHQTTLWKRYSKKFEN